MISSTECSQAATELLSYRVADASYQQLGVGIRPTSIDDALLIQKEMLTRGPVGAWKALLPPADDQVIVAPIFADTINQGKQCLLFADNNLARIEPEIAFILGKDLPAKASAYSEAEIDDAVATCHMALELMQDRFIDNSAVTFYDKLADCLVNQGLFIGPEIDKEKAYQTSTINISIEQKGNKQTFAGKHPNLSPQKPLYWLINYMNKRGVDFTAGQAVITGSYAGIVELLFNSDTEIEYQGLGKYSVEFIKRC